MREKYLVRFYRSIDGYTGAKGTFLIVSANCPDEAKKQVEDKAVNFVRHFEVYKKVDETTDLLNNYSILTNYKISYVPAEGKISIRHWWGCDSKENLLITDNNLSDIIDTIEEHEREVHGNEIGESHLSEGRN